MGSELEPGWHAAGRSERVHGSQAMGKAIWIGIVLTALGSLVLVAGSLPYTTEETTFELGPVKATAQTWAKLDIPPAIGWISMGTGSALLLIGMFKVVRGDVS